MLFKKKDLKKYRILSIDGGGMKGIFTAFALWKLEEDHGINLLDYFDMVVGTSTGALISAAILSGSTGKEIYEMYLAKDNEIFANKNSISEQIKSTFFASYKNDGLANYLKKEIGEHTMESLYKKNKVDFAFFATNFTKAQPIVYGSPSLNKSPLISTNSTLLNALLTTTAAPFFFEPLIDEKTNNLIMDGGLWANNPSLAGINLALTGKGVKLEQIEILSFGQTFTSDLNYQISKGKEVLISPMKNQFIQLLLSVLTLNQNSQTFQVNSLLGSKVYRYQPEVDQKGVSIDKVTNKFVNYSKVYWSQNQESLVKFIKTGENTKK